METIGPSGRRLASGPVRRLVWAPELPHSARRGGRPRTRCRSACGRPATSSGRVILTTTRPAAFLNCALRGTVCTAAFRTDWWRWSLCEIAILLVVAGLPVSASDRWPHPAPHLPDLPHRSRPDRFVVCAATPMRGCRPRR